MDDLDRLSMVESLAVAEEVASVLRHDLRNRLSVIKNAHAYIKRKLGKTDAWASDARIETFSKLIDDELGRSVETLETKIETQHLHALEKNAVDVSECVTMARSRARASLEARNRVELDVGPGRAVVDTCELALAVRALIENALEAKQGGRVHVHGRREGDFYVIEVRDDGPGIPEDKWEECFRQFASTKPGHAGLGLPMARRIAGRYGGSVRRGADHHTIVIAVAAAEAK